MCRAQDKDDEDYVRVDKIKDTLRRATNSAHRSNDTPYKDIGKQSKTELDDLTGMYNSSIENVAVSEKWLRSVKNGCGQ